MTSAPYLEGFAVAGYRSFGDGELQRVSPMTKVHLVAGPNNAGKSNVLRAALLALPSLKTGQAAALTDADLPSDQPSARMRVAIAHRLHADELLETGGRDRATADHLRIALSGTTFRDPSEDIIWFEFERGETLGSAWAPSRAQIEDIGAATQEFGRDWLSSLSSRLTSTGGGSVGDDEGRILDCAISALHVRDRLPPVVLLDAFRQITASGGEADRQHGGAGLIERLARLQNPAVGQRDDRRRFEGITRFVRTLLEDPAAEIEIPWERNTILIHHDDRLLPLENYGTGLHQVVILAAAATVLTGHLVCVEEPEIHLHPTLQRRLLRYLQQETDNQYLIATHSAHLLDTGRASITAARLANGHTELAPAIEPSEVAAISADLGFRASDLVQSNAVVWVEGPSDRIYVRFWLSAMDPQLLEGVHYTLMFYGGALLRHLSPDDPAVEEFISLPRINRNFAVVIDSDRSSRHARLNATKTRVRKAIEEYGSRASVWITSGYTIENYVPCELLAAAVQEVHPSAHLNWDGDRYTNPLAPEELGGRSTPADKTAVAQAVVGSWAPETPWPLDLKQQIAALVALLRRANDLSAT